MTEQDLEQKLRTALNHAAPNDLPGVLSRCNERKGIVIPMTKNTNRKSLRVAVIAAAACFALIFAGGTALYHNQINTVSSIVSLDVNPSIELTLNKKERVLSAVPLNQDAEAILEGMDLEGTPLDVAVNAVVGSLLKHGYVNELANSILITVENDDESQAAQLQKELTNTVNTVMQSSSVNGAILSQVVSQNQQLQDLADQYEISLGKAQLIQQLIEQNPTLTFDVLAEKTVNDLNLLLSSQAKPLSSISSTGSATDSGYIGSETAKRLALAHANVKLEEATITGIDFDLENGKMVYEVDFMTDRAVYEYDVDAKTGEILKSEKEDTLESSPATSVMDAAAAKKIALENFNVTEDQVEGLTVLPDYEDGALIFKVKFWQGNTEYSCEVNSAGQVTEIEKEEHITTDKPSTDVGTQAAKEAALKHAGLTENQVTSLRVKLDWDDGQRVYEVEFWQGSTEYDYDINADGTVRSFEKEPHTAPSVSIPTNTDIDDLEDLLDEDDLNQLKGLANIKNEDDFKNFIQSYNDDHDDERDDDWDD